MGRLSSKTLMNTMVFLLGSVSSDPATYLYAFSCYNRLFGRRGGRVYEGVSTSPVMFARRSSGYLTVCIVVRTVALRLSKTLRNFFFLDGHSFSRFCVAQVGKCFG